jgi:hypothetical protein
VKPAVPSARVSRTVSTASSASRTRQGLEPAVLGRSTPKDPAREQARQLARDQGLKPTRSSAQERLGKQEIAELEASAPSEQVSKRPPSRSSRSMKSRQSEPRVSRTGSKPGSKRSAKAVTKNKPPYVLMAIAAIVVVVGLIVLARIVENGASRTAGNVHVPTPQASATITTVPGQISSRASEAQVAGASSPSRIITAAVEVNQKTAMNLTPPKDIQLSQIAGFSNGIPPVIQFRDGSRMNADPVTLEQLPAEVRLQLTYTREQP